MGRTGSGDPAILKSVLRQAAVATTLAEIRAALLAELPRSLAESLRRGFGARGLAVCLGLELNLAPHCQEGLREVIRGAAAVLVVVGAGSQPSETQRWERQAVLEAVWRDPAKRLVPVLLRDAGLPPFLRSVFPADQPIPVYRLKRLRTDWPRAVADLAAVLRGQASMGNIEDVGELIDTTEEDRIRRRERFSYIRRIAESLPG